jgi:mono/diheme cytochrome c family protein
MRVILGVVAVLLLLAIGGVVLLYSGRIDVAARDQSNPVLRWLTDTAKRQSVRAHAGGIEVPQLGEPDMVEAGARQYLVDCVQCHGAPGAASHPFARAMRPEPPELTIAVHDWTAAELFWIVKNGLAFSGHPAWGAMRVDGEIWPVIAFLTQMPTTDVARWQALTAPPAPPEPAPAPSGEADMVPPVEEEPAPVPPEPNPGAAEPAPRQ